jgi:serine/threonine protein kinase
LDGKYQLTKQPGSAHYSAPEIYQSDNYDEKIDVFSFGSILYEILSLRPAFSPDLRPQVVMRNLVEGHMEKIPDDWEPQARGLVERCWRLEPGDRPKFSEITSSLTECNFQILPEVNAATIKALVAQVLEVESSASP